MPAANTDLFKKLTNNFSTTLAGAIVGSGDTSMSLGSTTNLALDTGIVLVVDRVNASGVATPLLREYIKGTVSGTNVINLVRGVGNSTAQAHLSGAVVEQVVDQTTINDAMAGILISHNQDGTIIPSSINSQLATLTSTQDGNATILAQRNEYFFDYIATGGVWSADTAGTNNNASMTALVAYQAGRRVTVTSVTARTFTASRDTYIDVLNTVGVGSLVYTEVTNNAASPALAANSIRLAIVVSGATFIANAASVNQGQETSVLPIASSVAYSVTDSLGNLISPRDPLRKILGYKQITSTATTANASSTQVPGLSCPVIIPIGRKVKITFAAEFFQGATATSNYFFEIWDGVVGSGTILRNGTFTTGGANFTQTGAVIAPLQTAITSAKTYNAGFHSSSALVSVGATPNGPAFIMVELA